MKTSYKILRFIIVTLMAIVIGVPLFLYVILSLPSIQDKIRTIGEQELTSLLGANVTIEDIRFRPFNKLNLNQITIATSGSQPDTLLTINRIGAGISYSELMQQRIVINYVELIGANFKLARPTKNTPLNIQPIIDRFKPQNERNNSPKINLKILNVVVRRCSLTYDIESEESKSTDSFDPNHIKLTNIRADLSIPRIQQDNFIVALKRLSFDEQSGFNMVDLHAAAAISTQAIRLSNLGIELPDSKLEFDSIQLDYNGWHDIQRSLLTEPHRIAIINNSHINLSDLSPLIPKFKDFNTPIFIDAALSGTPDSLDITQLDVALGETSSWLMLSGHADSLTNTSATHIIFDKMRVNAYGDQIANILSKATNVSPKALQKLNSLGRISIDAKAESTINSARFNGTINTGLGSIVLNTRANGSIATKTIIATGHINGSGIRLGHLFNIPTLGTTDCSIDFNIDNRNASKRGNINCILTDFIWNNKTYTETTAVIAIQDKDMLVNINIDDDDIALNIDGNMQMSGQNTHTGIHADIRHADLAAIGLTDKYSDYTLDASLDADFNGINPNTASGQLSLFNLRFTNPQGKGLTPGNITVEVSNMDELQSIKVRSTILKADIEGQYNVQTLASDLKNIAAGIFPQLITSSPTIEREEKSTTSQAKVSDSIPNNFGYQITISENPQLCEFLNTPVKILYPISITGAVNAPERICSLRLEAPYLQQKDKLIRNSSLQFFTNGYDNSAQMLVTTTVPTKTGDMNLEVSCNGKDDKLDTNLHWHIDTKRRFDGDINLTADFMRNPETDSLFTRIEFSRSEAAFNDTTWVLNPSIIDIADKHITIQDFDARRQGQSITINGVASPDSTDNLIINLRAIDLDYVFEALNIPNVKFGGIATGDFYGRQLLSTNPVLFTPRLDVKNISYNGCILGDADIRSHWNNTDKAVNIIADIKQANTRHAKINGAIFPMNDSLDFRFNADKTPVGFLQTFMSAFADKVDGTASGNARLWGNFKYIDMIGDLYADNFSVRLAFSNCTYYATDSVRLTPGRIDIHNLQLHDAAGNTALMNGVLTHSFFKEPHFKFDITQVQNMLVYNMGETTEHPWYGKVYGSGSAFITGEPGYVDIGVNMSTSPKSTFTFTLSNDARADEYSFITFRDRNRIEIVDTMQLEVGSPTLDNIMRQRVKHNIAQEDAPSIYRMNFIVDINPQAQINLIMDPVGGDRITAYGNGVMNVSYESANETFKMLGNYTLTKGNYNFTLQDIIIKDFTIREGSSIAFNGDPYAAQLNIDAIYSLNANLSDLDESFLQDKELNRTNVPVYAVLKVTGDMRQPEIAFDLEFPTLTHDTTRKVKSIVSTDDMMNRQIIYLLVLNRFYTPEYMASTTKGNELVSMASSTISSQLSNILGQLSDNWSVAPTVRTDRGDFSDVEVDVALSSTLLNNRLLFNGNFGYRDNAYNDNSFIGDFDLEYLLNRSGNLRLKAYNRYNDQNYYIKTALTTQGIGLVWKRDFDSIFPLFKWKRHKKTKNPNQTIDRDSTRTKFTE